MKPTNPPRFGRLAASASLLTSLTPGRRWRVRMSTHIGQVLPDQADEFSAARVQHNDAPRVTDWVAGLLKPEPANGSASSLPGSRTLTPNGFTSSTRGRRDKRFPGSIFLWSLLLVGLLGLMQPKQAEAFDLFGGTTAFSDLVGSPQDHPRWTDMTLTFKFDPSFDVLFPDPALKEQVRLVFTRWGQASGTPYGPTYHFDRTSVAQPFGDLRSIALHELGHVLGLHHPDEADAVSRNFQPAAHVCPSTESAQPDTGNEVMQSIINPGWYRHILTWDELDAYCFNYGSAAISFTEVFGATPADIVISSYVNPDPNNWAQGGFSSGTWINPANHSQGVSINNGAGFIQFNSHSGIPMGFKTHGINWDYLNTSGQPARSIQIRTRGTDNRNVPFHYDNFDWPHPFGTYAATLVGSSAKDDLLHTWSNPSGGDIPAGEIIHVGLELDVYDWTVVSAVVKDPLGIATSVGFVSFHDWNNTVFSAAALPSAPKEQQLRRNGNGTNTASGFRLVIPDSATHIASISLADVTGMHLTLPQLNRSLVQSLSQSNRLQTLAEFAERDFEPNNDFFFLLNGSAQDLPPNVRSNKNYLLLNRPDLAGRELLVFAVSTSPDATVGTYALLGTNAVASTQVPVLSVTPLSDCRVQVCWPYPSDGYVLQSAPSLTPPVQWNDVTLTVTVVNGLNCVIIPNGCQGAQFFRLVRKQLPTYSILGPGITPSQFDLLARRLHLPSSSLVNGVAVRYTDQTNFAQIPTEFIGTGDGTNEDSGNTVSEKIRFDLLNQIQVLDDATAVNFAQDALGNAGLRPAPPYSGWPEIGHAQFTAVSSNGATISDLPIDTQVRYNLRLGGLPLVGPGAKVAMAFDAARNVTHLAYALRAVEQGPPQPIVSQQEADAQAMNLYQGTAGSGQVQLSSRLVYYAPPPELTSAKTLLPYYQYDGTLFSAGANSSPVQLRRILIPAINNSLLVPAVKLTASVQGSYVFGQAFVDGGVPPYTFEWNSSSTTLAPSNTDYTSYSVPAGKTSPVTETVTVLVTDANGTRTAASQTFEVFTVAAAAPPTPKSWDKTTPPSIGGITDVGTEWVGTSMGLGGSAANAAGFVNRMWLGGSSIRFNYGDYNAWERDFKDPAFGGTDTSYVDNADAVFYTGHAGPNGWSFPGSHDDGSLNYWEARYGQNDIEWLVIAACGPLQTGTSPNAWYQRWGPAFQRLHLLCGYQTVTWDNTIEGFNWANYMQAGWTVRGAWMQTGKDAQGASERVAVMGVYDTFGVSNWNDHFWGRGSVGPDITSIGGYWMVSSPCD